MQAQTAAVSSHRPYSGFEGKYIGSSVYDAPTVPFGGEKNSGLGRFGGEWIIRVFTRDHWVTVQHSRPTYPF